MNHLQTLLPSKSRREKVLASVDQQLRGKAWHIGVIDDDPKVRANLIGAIRYTKDFDVDVAEVQGGPSSYEVQGYVQDNLREYDALVTDLHLKKRGGYSAVDGDEIAYWSNLQEKPAILCTFLNPPDARRVRSMGAFLPVRTDGRDVRAKNMASYMTRCMAEYQGIYEPWRQPFRTFARVETTSAATGEIRVILPGWSARETIRVPLSTVPELLRDELAPGKHVQVTANIGARTINEIYFADWAAIEE